MRQNRSIPDAVIIPELAYEDVQAAATWLCERFGFKERLRIGIHRIQLLFGSGALVVTERQSPGKSDQHHSVMVRVENICGHYANAVKHGVRILRPPADHPFGERQYTSEDLGGHIWTFTETIADSDPASWGGVLL